MTTLTVYPTQSGDDASQSSAGTVLLGQTTGGLASTVPYWGCRFENITIAGGSSISSATLSLYGFNSKNASLSSAVIKGVLQANPGVFTTTTSSVSTLYTGSPTTHSYSWTGTLSTSAYLASGSFDPIITELIAQGGWASGNAVALVIAYGASNALYYAYGTGSPKYEELTITYTSGGANLPAPLFVGQAVKRASFS